MRAIFMSGFPIAKLTTLQSKHNGAYVGSIQISQYGIVPVLVSLLAIKMRLLEFSVRMYKRRKEAVKSMQA